MTKTEKVLLFLEIMSAFMTAITVCTILFTDKDIAALVTLTGLWLAEAAHFHQVYAKKEGMANKQKYAYAWWKKILENPDISTERIEAVRGMASVVTEE